MSPSQLSKALKCMRHWYYDYVLHLPRPYHSKMAIGKAFHTSVEENLNHKIETSELLKKDELLSIASDAFDSESLIVDSWDEDRGTSKDKCISVAQKHHEASAPEIIPYAVEKEFSFDLLGLKVIGYIDIIEKTGPKAYRILDTKFKSRTPSNKVISEAQRIWYPKAARETLGLNVESFAFDIYIPLKKGINRLQIETPVNTEDEKMLERELELRLKMIDLGLFPRAPKELGICSYCPHYDYCWEKDTQ